MSELVYLIFILPGYFIFTILKSLLRGFGKNADVMDKVFYAMFFNLPVFYITLKIYNYLMKLGYIKGYDEKISELIDISDVSILITNINNLIWFICTIIATSFIMGVLAYYLIIITEKIGDKIRGYKVTSHYSIYNQCFAKKKEPIPIEIHDIKTSTKIDYGFMVEEAYEGEEFTEFLLADKELFNHLKGKDIIKEVECTYVNIEKGYKVILYRQNRIKDEVEKIKRRDKNG